jgi:hypothetical protein
MTAIERVVFIVELIIYKKCLIGVFWPPKNDPTLTIFDGRRDLNPSKVYSKYEF